MSFLGMFGVKRGRSAHHKAGSSRVRLSTTKLLHLFLRLCQLVQALVVIGFYGTYLNRAMKEDSYADGKWVFAVTVGSLGALVAVLSGLATSLMNDRMLAKCFPIDVIIMALWTVLTGIFGSMYFFEKVEMDQDVQKMKTAAVFDAVGIGLWAVSATIGGYMFRNNLKGRKAGTTSSHWPGSGQPQYM